MDAPDRDRKKSAGDPEGQTDHVDPKRNGSFSQTVEDAQKRAAGIQKRADPAEGRDKTAGLGAVKKKTSKPPAE